MVSSFSTATTALSRHAGLSSFPRPTLKAAPGLRLEASVLLLQLGQPFGPFGLHAAVLLLQAVVGPLGDLDSAANVGDGFDLGDQLLSGLDLADN